VVIERDVVVSIRLKQPGGKRKKTEQQVETGDYIVMGNLKEVLHASPNITPKSAHNLFTTVGCISIQSVLSN
jgi:hypothetical protein